jgi:predicted metal-dependent phosphoesterase TrpH
MERYFDFHNHTIYSDGIDKPKTVVKAQKLLGLDAIAITDHNNLDGYWEAKKAAEDWGIIVLPGVEFSSGKYHILGIGFNPYDEDILSVIEKSKNLQRENVKRRVKMLQDHGVPISLEKVETYSPKATLGKMNLMFALIQDPECRDYIQHNNPGLNWEQLRQFYIGSKGIAGTNEGMVDLGREVIIKSVHKAGGIGIPAHLPKDADNLEKEMEEFRLLEADGFEIQPNFYEKGYAEVEEYAKKHNLLLTYGSDYHGGYVPRGLLGRGMNRLYPELAERLNLDFNKADYKHNQTHERRFALAR